MGERKFTIRFDDDDQEWVGVRDSNVSFCPIGLNDIWDTDQYERDGVKLAFRVRTSAPRDGVDDWYRGCVIGKTAGDYPEVYLYETRDPAHEDPDDPDDDYAFPTHAMRPVGEWLKSHGFADDDFWVKLEEA